MIHLKSATIFELCPVRLETEPTGSGWMAYG